MFYGSIVFRFFGTLLRWLFKGFSSSFKEVWNGDGSGEYEIISNVLGFIVVSIIGYLIVAYT